MVVKFDTTEQEYKLKEAEADLAEAEQQVMQTKADNQAKEEETRYSLLQAKMDVKHGGARSAPQSDLGRYRRAAKTPGLEAAKDHLRQLEHDAANRQATSAAAVAIQEAARNKAKVQAETARQNIENMVLKSQDRAAMSTSCRIPTVTSACSGMLFPALQIGDTVNAGMVVAQIPDLKNWEVTASIGELDRGHLSVGQKVQVGDRGPCRASPSTERSRRSAAPSAPSGIAISTCKIALEQSPPGMRPGMSSNIVITTGHAEERALGAVAGAV